MSLVSHLSMSFIFFGAILNFVLLGTGFVFHQPVNTFIKKRGVSQFCEYSTFIGLSPHDKFCHRKTKARRNKGGPTLPWASLDDNTIEKAYLQRKLRPGAPNLLKEREALPMDFYRENPFDKFALALFRKLVQENTRGKDGEIYISPLEGKFHYVEKRIFSNLSIIINKLLKKK